jgi:hypothetical protein
MKLNELFKGQDVIDSWWPEHRGKIVKCYKTTVHVLYPSRYNDDLWIYDKEHAETFLVESP